MGAINVGTAPDSWGVWFADDPQQTPWARFLDEVVAAGYRRIELGPYGYLPTDPQQLKAELDQRGLTMTAGTTFEQLHRPDGWESTWQGVAPTAELAAAMGAKHLVVMPSMWRDADGSIVEERLDHAGQAAHGKQVTELGRRVAEEFGVRLQYHPHADGHIDNQHTVERFLEETDPEQVSLCLDTGHISYCGGDNLELIRKYPSRIGYLHLKQVNPDVLAAIEGQELSFDQAIERGVMAEPPAGIPEFPPLLDELAALGVDLFAIVEQDMYPCPPEAPLPIAARTAAYLRSHGGGVSL
ncbi:TIM barrel protein [Kribbella sandramycini]|uniref:Inosose dehydratase n=1 Tax=Kribbella sandramycini TaxID=60450 RepID=A0A7Y4NYR4_9ACTN|nr:sugar phosphate isomerase/epimerase [Kribbella sandramycini]MBB6567289.1 inosose dehydratase [Kribbella sandramycini]NOL40098.1 TIM barrel protein [Kribbella sandramycini]